MSLINQLFYLEENEGRVAKLLIRERKNLGVLQKRLWGDFYLRGMMEYNQYKTRLSRLKLLRIQYSQLIKILREDERYG